MMTQNDTLTRTLTERLAMLHTRSAEAMFAEAPADLAEAAVDIVIGWLDEAAAANRELNDQCRCPRDHDRMAACLEQSARLIETIR